jgi:hypothetical protein
MNKDNVLKQIEDKLLPTVKNLENGNASEHDIFPSLLWLLLENNKELERKISTLEEKIESIGVGISDIVEDILEKNKSQNIVLLEHIENLKQTSEAKNSSLSVLLILCIGFSALAYLIIGR